MGNTPHFYFDFYTNTMNDLEKEIENIRYELAVTIPEELQNASYSGDILECSEYSEILSRQTFLSLRLSQLNKRLHDVNSVNIKHISKTTIGIGSTVTLECMGTASIKKIKLVSCEMLDISNSLGEVTLNSPMGKALYNKTVNDIIRIHAPMGVTSYKILSFSTIHDT